MMIQNRYKVLKISTNSYSLKEKLRILRYYLVKVEFCKISKVVLVELATGTSCILRKVLMRSFKDCSKNMRTKHVTRKVGRNKDTGTSMSTVMRKEYGRCKATIPISLETNDTISVEANGCSSQC